LASKAILVAIFICNSKSDSTASRGKLIVDVPPLSCTSTICPLHTCILSLHHDVICLLGCVQQIPAFWSPAAANKRSRSRPYLDPRLRAHTPSGDHKADPDAPGEAGENRAYQMAASKSKSVSSPIDGVRKKNFSGSRAAGCSCFREQTTELGQPP
jgi:hypothetical protein